MEKTLSKLPSLIVDKHDPIQTLLNMVFVTSWIAVSLVVTLCLVAVIVLIFIT